MFERPGGGARDTKRRHHGFGARRDEAEAFDPWHARDDPLGQRERVRLARAEGPAVVDRFVHGGGDDRIAMAEDQRAEAQAEIDVGRGR